MAKSILGTFYNILTGNVGNSAKTIGVLSQQDSVNASNQIQTPTYPFDPNLCFKDLNIIHCKHPSLVDWLYRQHNITEISNNTMVVSENPGDYDNTFNYVFTGFFLFGVITATAIAAIKWWNSGSTEQLIVDNHAVVDTFSLIEYYNTEQVAVAGDNNPNGDIHQ